MMRQRLAAATCSGVGGAVNAWTSIAAAYLNEESFAVPGAASGACASSRGAGVVTGAVGGGAADGSVGAGLASVGAAGADCEEAGVGDPGVSVAGAEGAFGS